jgi:ArsR family transcriptional regulator, arsenate/arsenite/antimonite-responsive transcriptional repressor
MDDHAAIAVLTALAQPTRLEVFRRLVAADPSELPAGGIARLLNIPHNTLSSHLAVLARSGLISSTRDGRTIRYRAELDAVRTFVAFLTEDCCCGRPEICVPLLDGPSQSARLRPAAKEVRHG